MIVVYLTFARSLFCMQAFLGHDRLLAGLLHH